jgi:hypothetical protein
VGRSDLRIFGIDRWRNLFVVGRAWWAKTGKLTQEMNGNFKYMMAGIVAIFGIAAVAATKAESQISIAILGGSGAILSALLANLSKLVEISEKASEISTKQDEVKVAVAEVHDTTNSKMAELMEQSKVQARAEGVLAEKTRNESLNPEGKV